MTTDSVPAVGQPAGDRVLLLACEVEIYALQLENMALRHAAVAQECLALAGRMRATVAEHRSAVHPGVPAQSTAGRAER